MINFDDANFPMEEPACRDYLEEKRREIKTSADFEKFIKFLKDNESVYDYGTVVVAIGQACLAMFDGLAKDFGITGFQASCVMWEFVRGTIRDSKIGMRLVNYDNMLYPQYEYKFEKTISPGIFKALQEEAKKRLAEDEPMHELVRKHMQSIVDGVVPFGYKLEEEE